MRTDHVATLVEATDLLNIELPDRRWADESHLEWLDRANPFGEAVFGFRRDGDRLDAHYALIPQEYRSASGPERLMFSLNAVTRSVGQRKGHFWSIGEEVYARAAEEYGARGIIGVSNDNSTPPVVKRLGWRLMGPLPVRIVPRSALHGGVAVEHHLVDVDFLASDRFEQIVSGLDHPVAWGWRNRPTPTYLRWRLASPNTEPFHLHLSEDLVMVSLPSHLGPLRASVVLKLIPRNETVAPVDAAPMVAAVAAYHHAAFSVYAGFNARVRVGGMRPPRRFQPAPLNLIYRPLPGAIPAASFRLDTFEFLDMDAY